MDMLPAVGTSVRLTDKAPSGQRQRGKVVETDERMNVACVALHNGRDVWVLADNLEPVPLWSGRGEEDTA